MNTVITVPRIEDIAAQVRPIIEAAERDGVEIHDGNVVDLLADNVEPIVSLADIRVAITVAGLAPRFPNATRGDYPDRLASAKEDARNMARRTGERYHVIGYSPGSFVICPTSRLDELEDLPATLIFASFDPPSGGSK